mmetsp:Transcript_51944/g.111080  ORF Transcript_51944/g.111080 Transcript_51944/m.111080 type:complete len:298 (-) Transcript_51944:430-1323(-)
MDAYRETTAAAKPSDRRHRAYQSTAALAPPPRFMRVPSQPLQRPFPPEASDSFDAEGGEVVAAGRSQRLMKELVALSDQLKKLGRDVRSPSAAVQLPPAPEPEKTLSVDGETQVPQGLFEDLLRRGREARRRGQHVLAPRPSKTPDGGPKVPAKLVLPERAAELWRVAANASGAGAAPPECAAAAAAAAAAASAAAAAAAVVQGSLGCSRSGGLPPPPLSQESPRSWRPRPLGASVVAAGVKASVTPPTSMTAAEGACRLAKGALVHGGYAPLASSGGGRSAAARPAVGRWPAVGGG